MEVNKNQQWTAEGVAERFEECVDVINKLPGGISMGCKSFWPEIQYTPQEIAKQEKKSITRLRPLPDAIDRAEECLTWITWVNHGERNLIWLRAHGVGWKGISRDTGFPIRSAQRYWLDARKKIAERLNSCVESSGVCPAAVG